MALSLSIDDYVVSAFNAGIGNTTLPLYIYSAIKFGVSPEINAISTIVVAVTAVAILVAGASRCFLARSGRRPRTPSRWPPRARGPDPAPPERQPARFPAPGSLIRRSRTRPRITSQRDGGPFGSTAMAGRPRNPCATASASAAFTPNRRSE